MFRTLCLLSQSIEKIKVSRSKILMKISLTFTLTLSLLFYVSHLFSHPENNSKVLFEKPFINSMEQEAYVLGLKLSPNSIACMLGVLLED